MSVLMRNMMEDSSRSVFSLTLHDEPSYCSELSWESEYDSDSFISEDDDYLDSQMMKGDFILEKPLEINEVDRMFDWGVGFKAPPKFNESVHDFAVKLPTRRDSITEDEFRSDAFESVFSIISEQYESKDIDSLASDADCEADGARNQMLSSKSFTSLLGFEDEDADGPDAAPASNAGGDKGSFTDRESLIKQVTSMSSMVGEEESIADSEYIPSNSGPLEDRWTEGGTHEKLGSSSGASRWKEGLTPDKSQRPSIERPMMPPRRSNTDAEDWGISKRHSINSSSIQFEIVNSKIQAEVGLRMSDSLPAQKIMEAIMSVLQNPEDQEESKEESKEESNFDQ
mmetsp:Transcript_40386/g.97500  ORF Transcript_40386/g.97500 Transcript_40386/m.97500 type:complete len:341 (+) Transcript_40386:87-1109(+)